MEKQETLSRVWSGGSWAAFYSRSVIALDKAVHLLVSTSYRDLIQVGVCVCVRVRVLGFPFWREFLAV